MIETERLILRRWRAKDREPYEAMTSDPEVMDWLGGTLTGEETQARVDRIEAHFDRWGYGRFALERKADGAFLGYCGIAHVFEGLPVTGVEIGWGLARHAWGQGYVSEAARAATSEGLARWALPEVLAFTADTNLRSQAVMVRSGFTRDPSRDFDHPILPVGHPLSRHLVFFARPPSPPGEGQTA